MSEMGEDFAAWNKVKQAKRADNRKRSADLLALKGVRFTMHNAGAHLIIQADGYLVDFWPGTGKWATRGHRFSIVGRGVRNLLSHLEKS